MEQVLANKQSHKVSGVLPSYFPFYCYGQIAKAKGATLILVARDDDVYTLADQMRCFLKHDQVIAFPSWDCLPYDRVSPSHGVTQERLTALYTLLTTQENFLCVITSIAGLGQKLLPKSLLEKESLTIEVGQTYSRQAFLELLTSKGLIRVESVYDVGEFAVRGSLIDVFPSGMLNPVRLDFFGDELESIRPFDLMSQKTISSDPLTRIEMRASHEVLINQENITRFRSAYRDLFGGLKDFPKGDALYRDITEGRQHPGMEHWLPLFYEQTHTLLDYMPILSDVIVQEGCSDAVSNRLCAIADYFQMRQNPPLKLTDSNSIYNPLDPTVLYWGAQDWQNFLNQSHVKLISSFSNIEENSFEESVKLRSKIVPSLQAARDQSPATLVEAVASYFKSLPNHLWIIACHSAGSRDRVVTYLQEFDFPITLQEEDQFPTDYLQQQSKLKTDNAVLVVLYPANQGFETDHIAFLTEVDIFGEHIRKAKPKTKARKAQAFFQELNQLTVDDLVVHRDHGVGRYLGLDPVEVDGYAHDCLVLSYDGGDKLFLPVENIELVTRYGDADSLIQLDRLGSNAWQNKKERVKKRIQIVADYLIQLAAERSQKKGVVLSQTDSAYDRFCDRFIYDETDDQLRAIEDVVEDLASGKPMDRLVCGDVGFGKTEVALRAAFLSVMNGKQVAIIVPTTLLCRQHYETFSKRFHGFGFEIRQLSRLVKANDKAQTLADLSQGRVDIVISTHALLAKDVKFHDLGLVIIDEEQHFGVKQKEKLKAFRADVHVLTLTATPIPRTLQMSLSGVRDLSLIATPPVDRLVVRTFVMPMDDVVIRDAIEREYHRGGQIFYVTPRLEDLEDLKVWLKELVPHIRVRVATGQLSPQELEDVMGAFYDRQFDLLLATNIIESGIDIPTANTLIVHRCDLFGLSQLYQLRGRVGRAKTQGYAYFTYQENKTLTENAVKRFHVLQSLDSLGAGFTLASHDLDIRGAGNIVGEEQSGHIREVGVELYQTLLQEAILMQKVKDSTDNLQTLGLEEEMTPQIHLGLPVLIPQLYVSDLGLRLSLYRRVSQLRTRQEIDAFATELRDRFGKLPPEVDNLLDVVEIKAYCRSANIEKVEAGPKGVLVTFFKNEVKNQPALFSFLQRSDVAKLWTIKLRPDHKLFLGAELKDPKVKRMATKNIIKALSHVLTSC